MTGTNNPQTKNNFIEGETPMTNKEIRQASAKLDEAYTQITDTMELLDELAALAEGLKVLINTADKLTNKEGSKNAK
jgi:hypothetical protein